MGNDKNIKSSMNKMSTQEKNKILKNMKKAKGNKVKMEKTGVDCILINGSRKIKKYHIEDSFPKDTAYSESESIPISGRSDIFAYHIKQGKKNKRASKLTDGIDLYGDVVFVKKSETIMELTEAELFGRV